MSLVKDQDGGLRVISMCDLITHPMFNKIGNQSITIGKGKNTREITGLEAMLFLCGLNVLHPYESEIIEHRSEMTGDRVTCERFVGPKRSDEEWVKLETLHRHYYNY